MSNRLDDKVPEAELSLDDLFEDAQVAQASTQLAKNPKHRRAADPSVREALDAAAKKMRELYTLPDNWERTRGIALIDKGTQTLVGNFSEYTHKSLRNTRRLVREHTPISIDATELVEGYLGAEFQMRHSGISWEREVEVQIDIWMDELMLGAPKVELIVKLHLGALLRCELKHNSQFASVNGAQILQLPAGTNILEQLSTDSKTHLRRQVSG